MIEFIRFIEFIEFFGEFEDGIKTLGKQGKRHRGVLASEILEGNGGVANDEGIAHVFIHRIFGNSKIRYAAK